MVEPYKPIYTVKEAAKVLCTNINSVYALMNSRRLPYLIIGSKKIRGLDLEQFINSHPVALPEEKEDLEKQADVHN